MTVGAAGGLNIIFKTILDRGSEVVVFAPYFGEYKRYAANFGGKLVEVAPNTMDFQPDMEDFERKLTPATRAVIVNTPNNPTGVIYSPQTMRQMADILRKYLDMEQIYRILDAGV